MVVIRTGRSSAGGGGKEPDDRRRSFRPAARKTSVSGRSAKAPRPGASLRGEKHIRKRELIPFTRQAAGMLNAGMSIIAVLTTLEEQSTHIGLRTLLLNLRSAIEGGAPFSQGLALYPQIFDDMYVNMVKAGETSGQFAEIMRRLATLLDSAARLVRKVKSAITYPLVIMCLAVIIAFLLITFVVPVFGEMYEGFGSELPKPTQMLVDISAFIGEYWYYILGGLFAAGSLIGRWARTSSGQRTIHSLVLRMPVFGPLILKVVIARFARLLGQMLASGISILDAMEITARSCGNRIIESSLMESRRMVEEGETLSASMEGRPYLPLLMVRMAAAGEKSGRLDEMLTNVADAYDDEVETHLATLTSLLEPFLMVFLGVFIGGIVIALFLPIFGISNVISG